MSRIVITDCDQGTVEIERGVFEAAGHTLTWEACRTPEDVIRTGDGAAALLVQYVPITAEVMDALPGVREIRRCAVWCRNRLVWRQCARGRRYYPIS